MTTTDARVFVDTNVLLRAQINAAPLHNQAVKLILELSIEVVKLVSKVVNYGRPIRKLHALV